MLDLKEIRGQIDETDRKIVECYQKRMELVQQVAEYKLSTGKKVLDREREAAKLDAVEALADGAFHKQAVREIFTQLIAISRKQQYRMLAEQGREDKLPFTLTDELIGKGARVVFQGVEGAYSHIVTQRLFGEDADSYHVSRFRDVCEEVAAGRADFGVLPIENSSAGMVSDVYDLLVEYENVIAAEYDLKVEHALLGLPGAKLADIRTVYSHPQGLMQCGGFLGKHPDWRSISLANTAVAAQKVLRDNDASQAAIASPLAAKIHGLQILEYPVNDNRCNTTRFIVIRKDPVYSRDADKLSLCFEIRHESGSLYNTLSHLIFNNLNMTKIESRPIPDKPWEYRFYVDIEGNMESPGVQNALQGIQAEVINFQILGCYRNQS